MRAWWIAIVSVAAGCDLAWTIPSYPPPPDAALPPACLIDAFDGDHVDLKAWDVFQPAGYPVTVTESGGALVVTLAPDMTAVNGVSSRRGYDMTGGSITIELVTPAAGPRAEGGIDIAIDPENYYDINVDGGMLLLRVRSLAIPIDLTVGFDATQDRFLRMRHDVAGAAMAFETSPNGTDLTTQAMMPAVVAVTNLVVDIYADTYQLGSANPGAVRFANLRLVSAGCGAT